MDYKRKEILTKDNIKKDIRNQCARNILQCSLLVITFIGMFVLLWYLCDLHKASSWDNNFLATFIIFYICFSLCIIVYWIYLICRYFQSFKTYSIVTDKFTGVYAGKFWLRRNDGHAYPFHFAANGYFEVYLNKIYYPWANYYKMYGTGVMQCSIPNEEFYVVVANKKIVSIYNKKMFELSDEFKN